MSQCYYSKPGGTSLVLNMDDFKVCPNGINCCNKGSVCLSNAICRYADADLPPPGQNHSGYYMGSCTDRSFDNQLCSTMCSNLPNPDVVYNNETQTWACCGADGAPSSCNNPTTDTFAAPAPEKLLIIVSSSASTSVASGTSTNSVPASTSTSSSNSSSAVSNGLSPGVKAAIGVGTVLGIVFFIALGALGAIMFKKRSAKKNKTLTPILPAQLAGYPVATKSQEVQELGGPGIYSYPVPAELESNDAYIGQHSKLMHGSDASSVTYTG